VSVNDARRLPTVKRLQAGPFGINDTNCRLDLSASAWSGAGRVEFECWSNSEQENANESF